MGLKSVFIRIDFNWIQLICECRCSPEWLACLQVPAGHPQAISDPRHVLIYLTAWQQYYLWSGSGSYRCFSESTERAVADAAAVQLHLTCLRGSWPSTRLPAYLPAPYPERIELMSHYITSPTPPTSTTDAIIVVLPLAVVSSSESSTWFSLYICIQHL